jgi:hypothetical protein
VTNIKNETMENHKSTYFYGIYIHCGIKYVIYTKIDKKGHVNSFTLPALTENVPELNKEMKIAVKMREQIES